MSLLETAMPDGRPNDLTSAFLRASGVFDEFFYRRTVDLPAEADAALHYLNEGWRAGLEPNEGFDGRFLHPFYLASGYDGAPALTFADLSAMGGSPLPRNAHEASALADEIRQIPLFDPISYARLIPGDLDPVLHYVVAGERLGWRPSAEFDPAFYIESYPEIVVAGVQPLRHFWFHGRFETRVGLSATERLSFPALTPGERPVVLLVSHEATRTGAPVLGWNILSRLSRRYRVVSLLLNDGVLEDDFAALASVQIGPMRRDEWTPSHARLVAEKIHAHYRPAYAIANSLETHFMVPALERAGIPTVSLVHEFPAYTNEANEKISNVFNWSGRVVFPARVVAKAYHAKVPALEHRSGICIKPQGRSELPPAREGGSLAFAIGDPQSRLKAALRPAGMEDAFLVLGVGTVELRKGVDLFLSTASTLKRMHPAAKFRFVWIGGRTGEIIYNNFLADQIERSDLGDAFEILPPEQDLGPAYDLADAFFLSSRLDPQPNVGIDAITRAIPTISFEGASGTSEVLQADEATRHLVVPYLDVHGAACAIARLAEEPAAIEPLRREISRLGSQTFDIEAYVEALDGWGLAGTGALSAEDVETLAESGVLDEDFALPPGVTASDPQDLASYASRQWALWNLVEHPQTASPLRRPFAGFHPQTYAQRNLDRSAYDTTNPVVHWLRAGRPEGAWSHPVHVPAGTPEEEAGGSPLRIAVHSHFYYTDTSFDFMERVAGNRSTVDLFLTTGSEEGCADLRRTFRHHAGRVDIRIVPNRGRDIGPFLTALNHEITELGYDIVGHFHGKKTLVAGGTIGETWRRFLWENLVGGEWRMIDFCASLFQKDDRLGLLFADDPHLAGWDRNRVFAEELAERMNLRLPLDDFFDFPVGTMFWARPAALKPLFDLRLDWSDYPQEPVPYDGSLLHAIERLLPFVARHADHSIAGVHVPGTSW